jgi:hypothetical protein
MARPQPGKLFRDALEHKRRTLPIFLRPQLADVLGQLDDWVASVELRLITIEARQRALDKLPAAESLDVLVSM